MTKVIINILGGVAEIEECPENVEVIIKYYDNFPENGLTK